MTDDQVPGYYEMKRIRQLIKEIRELDDCVERPVEYFQGFLTRLLSAVGAPAGGAYLFESDQHLRLVYQVNFALVDVADNKNREIHNTLLRFALRTAKPLMVPPFSDEFLARNPTANFIFLTPIRVDGKVVGLIEVFQDASRNPDAQKGFFMFIQKMTEIVSAHFQTMHQIGGHSPRADQTLLQRISGIPSAIGKGMRSLWRNLRKPFLRFIAR